ncbi:MAG: sugar phosphate isomerase/epimerase [Chloroflexi bacterium]|nr:sugar phosphate isomerase/epimerase [Chloroflexota bacterium]
MQTHWSAHLTLSLVHFMAFPETIRGEGPIVETVTQVAKDDFFSGIEVAWIKEPEKRKQVKAILASAHLAGTFGAQPALISQKLDLNSTDATMRARAVAQMKECIDMAVDLEFSRLSLLSGFDPGEHKRNEAFKLLADSMNQICAYGRQHGVGITLEIFDRDVDTKALLGPAQEAADFAKLIKQDYPNFGLMYDLSHQPLLKEETIPTLRTLQDHLAHVHVGNCVTVEGRPAFGDKHPRFGFPGSENDIDQLAEFLCGLFAIGYLRKDRNGIKPWVGIEVKPQPGESSDLLLAGTRRAWAEAWARI